MASGDIVLYNDDNNWASLPIKMYSERSAPDFVPRIGSDLNQSNLDTTLQKTLRPRGSFQPLWDEDDRAALSYGYFNPVDAALYPVIPITTTGMWFGDSTPFGATVGATTIYTAKAVSNQYVLVALREGSTNKLVKISVSGVASVVTLPVAISGSSCQITGITFHKDMAFISGQMLNTSNVLVSFNTHRYNPSDDTFQDVGTPVQLLTSMRNVLYGVGYNSHFVTITNEFAGGAATYTSIAFAYPTWYAIDKPLSVTEFNGALWLAKQSGLWRFDGVSTTKVLDLKPEFLTAFQGALYFRSGDWLCRFTGSLFERLQYFGPNEDIEDIGIHQERLLIVTSGTGSFTPTQGALTATHLYRVWSFDGAYFSCLYEKSGTPDAANEALPRLIFAHKKQIWIALDESTSTTWNLAYFDENSRFNGLTSTAHITTPDFTAGFENVTKIIRRLEVDILNAGASDSLTIKYQCSRDGKTWDPILTAGTLTSLSSTSSVNFVDFQDGNISNIGKKYRFFVTLSTSSSKAAIRSLTVHYSIAPSHRRKISATIPLTYTTENKGLVNRDGDLIDDYYFGTYLTLTPSTAYHFIHQLTDPIDVALMFLPYRSTLKYALDASSANVYVNGHFPANAGVYNSEDLTTFVAIKTSATSWEIVRAYTTGFGANSTTLFCERGVFKSTPATHSLGAEVRLAIPVSIKILNNALILDDTTQTIDDYGLTQIASDLTIEATEV